jgi:hypothetical protein
VKKETKKAREKPFDEQLGGRLLPLSLHNPRFNEILFKSSRSPPAVSLAPVEFTVCRSERSMSTVYFNDCGFVFFLHFFLLRFVLVATQLKFK